MAFLYFYQIKQKIQIFEYEKRTLSTQKNDIGT